MATALPMMQLKSSIIHVEEVSDIDGIYTSSYKYATKCPSSITVKGTTLSPDKKVASTLVSGIVINGDVCTGGTMSSVTEDVARDKLALDALGFSGVYERIQQNGPARATTEGGFDKASTLVAWDDIPRTCGDTTYGIDTFYFTLQEASGQVITISSPAGNSNVVIPDGKKS
jgi:hypothetical protein